ITVSCKATAEVTPTERLVLPVALPAVPMPTGVPIAALASLVQANSARKAIARRMAMGTNPLSPATPSHVLKPCTQTPIERFIVVSPIPISFNVLAVVTQSLGAPNSARLSTSLQLHRGIAEQYPGSPDVQVGRTLLRRGGGLSDRHGLRSVERFHHRLIYVGLRRGVRQPGRGPHRHSAAIRRIQQGLRQGGRIDVREGA